MKVDIYTVRQMRARFAAALAVAVLSTWAIAGSAMALESGVHVDPGSPAGKEYAVPLSVLRAAAAGRPGGGDEGQPLFGVGISPARASSRADRTRRATHGHPAGAQAPARGAHAPSGGSRRSAAAGPGAAPTDSRVVEELTPHGSAAPGVALIAVLVVVGGLGGGALLLAARRRLG